MATDDPLEALQSWYQAQCNGEWEEEFGVKIDTLDNPGWMVKIDLKGTRWAGVSMTRKEMERSETDWFQCWTEKGQFHGAGGPKNLSDIVAVFFSVVAPDSNGEHRRA